METEMVHVTGDAWADFCADYRNYATEGVIEGGSTMNIFESNTKTLIARVVYLDDGRKSYLIAPEAAATCEKIDYAAQVKARNA
jgi:ribosomal protein L2